MPSESKPTMPKKPYTSPKLSKHGTVDAITLGGTSGSPEGGGKAAKKKA